MLEKISAFYFILAFAVGLFYCYISSPKPNIVMKFPSPYNAGKVIYKNNDNSCYKYSAEKVSCPRDKSKIKSQPISEDFSL